MAVAAHATIGRDTELEAIACLLDVRESPPAALVLEGEPGIGKTTVWRCGVELAANRGHTVLSCTPALAETTLAYAALSDLLGPALEVVQGALPEPQRRALAIALLREPSEGAPADARAIAAACLGVVRAVAESGPLLLALDDVQWLDRESAAAIAFAARRLREERVAFLLAQRPGSATGTVCRALGERAETLVLGPLSLGALHHIVRTRLGVSLPRPTLLRLQRISQGNPFYALELARALQAGDRHPDSDQLSIPPSLRELVQGRLKRLPAATRMALLAAATAASPELDLLRHVLDVDDVVTILDPALEAGVVTIEDGRVRFSHPLLASTLYADAAAGRRRALHRRLGTLAATPEERARHLARAVDGPDAPTAAALEDAARSERLRGAPETAAELALRAARLTPADDGSAERRRSRLAAESWLVAGDGARARQLLEALVQRTADAEERAEALLLLARPPFPLKEARVLAERALAEASPARRSEILIFLAQVEYVTGAGVEAAIARASDAVGCARAAGDERREAIALGLAAFLRGIRGGGFALEEIERAARLELDGGERPGADSLALIYAWTRLWSDDLDQAAAWLEELDCRARESGDVIRLELLRSLGQVAYRAGHWQRAERYYAAAVELAEQCGLEPVEEDVHATTAFLDASLGRVEVAREAARRSLASCEAASDMIGQLRDRMTLGFIELSAGAYAEAAEHSPAGLALARRLGIGDPGICPRLVPGAVDALVALGQTEEAAAAAAQLATAADALGRPMLQVHADYCNGVVAAARGELAEAVALLEKTRESCERLSRPFEHGRTLLALGTALRRTGRKRDSRVALEKSVAIFSELGAPLWAEKARAELARIGGRTPRGRELTPAEERIAMLVASGKTNKQAAAELYLTVHTIEAALTRIYRKLGVRSRTQLASLFATGAKVPRSPVRR